MRKQRGYVKERSAVSIFYFRTETADMDFETQFAGGERDWKGCGNDFTVTNQFRGISTSQSQITTSQGFVA